MDIRHATVEDAEAIRQIYNEEVMSGTGVLESKPRSVAEQRAWMSERSGVHVVLVAVDGPTVIGFGSMSPYRNKTSYRTTVEHSVYVAADRRRSGAGRLLLSELIEQARNHGFHAMIGRVTADNGSSLVLHEQLGFERIGLEREVGRKFNAWVDVVPMQILL